MRWIRVFTLFLPTLLQLLLTEAASDPLAECDSQPRMVVQPMNEDQRSKIDFYFTSDPLDDFESCARLCYNTQFCWTAVYSKSDRRCAISYSHRIHCPRLGAPRNVAADHGDAAAGYLLIACIECAGAGKHINGISATDAPESSTSAGTDGSGVKGNASLLLADEYTMDGQGNGTRGPEQNDTLEKFIGPTALRMAPCFTPRTARKLPGSTFASEQPITLALCQCLCAASWLTQRYGDKRCRSMNYATGERRCELSEHDHETGAELEVAGDAEIYISFTCYDSESDMTQIIIEQCEGRLPRTDEDIAARDSNVDALALAQGGATAQQQHAPPPRSADGRDSGAALRPVLVNSNDIGWRRRSAKSDDGGNDVFSAAVPNGDGGTGNTPISAVCTNDVSHCFEVLPLHVFAGVAIAHEQEVTFEQCRCVCATSVHRYGFRCRSAVFHRATGACALFDASRASEPALLRRVPADDSVVYIGIACTDEGFGEERLRGTCGLWYERQTDTNAVGGEPTLPPDHGTSPAERLAVHNRIIGQIVQQALVKGPSRPISNRINDKYTEGANTDYCFAEHEQSVLKGAGSAIIKSVGVAQCKCECASATRDYGFKCMSIQYYYDTGVCLLNRQTARTLGREFMRTDNRAKLSYFEFHCADNPKAVRTYKDMHCDDEQLESVDGGPARRRGTAKGNKQSDDTQTSTGDNGESTPEGDKDSVKTTVRTWSIAATTTREPLPPGVADKTYNTAVRTTVGISVDGNRVIEADKDDGAPSRPARTVTQAPRKETKAKTTASTSAKTTKATTTTRATTTAPPTSSPSSSSTASTTASTSPKPPPPTTTAATTRVVPAFKTLDSRKHIDRKDATPKAQPTWDPYMPAFVTGDPAASTAATIQPAALHTTTVEAPDVATAVASASATGNIGEGATNDIDDPYMILPDLAHFITGPCRYSAYYQSRFIADTMIIELPVSSAAMCFRACALKGCRSANMRKPSGGGADGDGRMNVCELYSSAHSDYMFADRLAPDRNSVYFDAINCLRV